MKKYRIKLITLVICFLNTLLFFNPIFAWDATGHILIAQIAYNNLTPIAQKDVDELIEKTSFAHDFKVFSPYVYSAPWPDYLNHGGQSPSGKTKKLFNTWWAETKKWHHYTDDPIVIGKYLPPAPTKHNVVSAIKYFMSQLPSDLRHKDYNLAAYDLVFLTHIVGDVHQPLHNADLYDSDFPKGDVAGNLYKIHSSFDATNLHAVWDESLGRFNSWTHFSPYAGYRPPFAYVLETAAKFQLLCRDTNNFKPIKWQRATHKIALNFVYPIYNHYAPLPNKTLSNKYIFAGQAISANQMCLAGKRLAFVLNTILSKPLTINSKK